MPRRASGQQGGYDRKVAENGHHTASVASYRFPPQEWDLLVRLPARVMIAAAAARYGSAPRTVAEGLAGIDAIADGRGSDSRLVRAVVAAIFAEPDDMVRPVSGNGSGEHPTAGGGGQAAAGAGGQDAPGAGAPMTRAVAARTASAAEVFSGCRSAAMVLADRAEPADSAAYRQWLRSIAARVCATVRPRGLPGVGDQRRSDPGRRFLDDLTAALGLS